MLGNSYSKVFILVPTLVNTSQSKHNSIKTKQSFKSMPYTLNENLRTSSDSIILYGPAIFWIKTAWCTYLAQGSWKLPCVFLMHLPAEAEKLAQQLMENHQEGDQQKKMPVKNINIVNIKMLNKKSTL